MDMNNIEDIKILKQFNPGDEYTGKIKKAIENILEEREQDKKRIKELEEIDTANRKVIVEQCDYIQNKNIPVQKVKDLIENETINISGFECIAVEDLEELLEEDK